MTRPTEAEIARYRAEGKSFRTGRSRRRWFFWRQWEYESAAWVGGKWQNPSNMHRWPRGLFWTYDEPREV